MDPARCIAHALEVARSHPPDPLLVWVVTSTHHLLWRLLDEIRRQAGARASGLAGIIVGNVSIRVLEMRSATTHTKRAPDRVLWCLAPLPATIEARREERAISIVVEDRLNGAPGTGIPARAGAWHLPADGVALEGRNGLELWWWTGLPGGTLEHPGPASATWEHPSHHRHDAISYESPAEGLRFTVFRAVGCSSVFVRVDWSAGRLPSLNLLHRLEEEARPSAWEGA